MTRHPKLVLALATVATLLSYAVCLLGTGLAACGLFGCSSGGKAAYAPAAAQIGLLLCGLVLVPLALLLVGRAPRRAQAAYAAVAVALGSIVAMAVLGLGPHGCPASQSRATTSAQDVDPGSATCSGDHSAV